MVESTKTDKDPLLTGWKVGTGDSFSYPSDSNHGADFLHLGFDISGIYGDLDSPLWSMDRWGTERVPGFMHPQLFYTHPFGETNVEVEVRTLDWRCYLRFNPSRAVFGKSLELLHPDAVEPLVERLLYELQPLVTATFVTVNEQGEFENAPDWSKQVSVSRIDCARNLLIDDPEQFKQAVMRSNPSQNPTIQAFGKKGYSWGLVHATKTVGKDRLYDKDADLSRFNVDTSLVEEPGNWFRFEAELRADRIKQFGLSRLSDIKVAAVWAAIDARWNASNWGVVLNAPGEVTKSLQGLSVNDKCNLLGYHSMHMLGLQHEIPNSRHRKYAKLAKTVGLNLHEPIESQGEPARRVDLWAGKIIDL